MLIIVGHDDKLDSLRREFNGVASLSEQQLQKRRDEKHVPPKISPPRDSLVKEVIQSLDERGAWVENGKLKYHGKSDSTTRIIDSTTFIKNLRALSLYLTSVKPTAD